MSRSKQWMRILDRSFGGVLARLLQKKRKRNFLPANPRRIGVLQPSAIGDTVLASGVLEAARRRFPDADFFFFHGHNNAPACVLLSGPLSGILCDFINPWVAYRILKSSKLDLLIDFSSWPNITAICCMLSTPTTIGFSSDYNPIRAGLFDIVVKHRSDRHELDNFSAMAEIFDNLPYKMLITTTDCQFARSHDSSRWIVCHLSAGGARAIDKSWPLHFWADLCRKLVDAGYIPIFTGTNSDQQAVEDVMALMAESSKTTISVCGKIPLVELGDLLGRVCLVITVDTSILHIASAINAYVLGLHGPTRAWRWGARSPRARSLESTHPLAGCISYGFESDFSHQPIMAELKPENVAEVAFSMLAEHAAGGGVVTIAQ